MSAAEHEVKDDLRGQLESAFEEAKDTEQPEAVEQPEAKETPEQEEPEGRQRDEKGRFVAKEQPEEPEKVESKQEPEKLKVEEKPDEAKEAPETALAPPNGWTAEAKAKWHELPEEVQAAVQKREQDVHKQISKSDDERNFGREVYRAVSPYMAQIQAEGGTPVAAIQSLLNTAYVLRSGSAQQKQQALHSIAREYDIPLQQQQSKEDGEIPPYIQPLYQEVNQLKGMLTQREQAEQQRIQSEVQSELEAFASDPAHTHFEEVKAHMAALLKEGAATDLKDAYEQAIWARPDIRTTLLAQQKAEEEQKRKSEAKRKAEEAKRKSVSITGGPGNTAAKSAPEDRSLREELEAQYAAQSGAV